MDIVQCNWANDCILGCGWIGFGDTIIIDNLLNIFHRTRFIFFTVLATSGIVVKLDQNHHLVLLPGSGVSRISPRSIARPGRLERVLCFCERDDISINIIGGTDTDEYQKLHLCQYCRFVKSSSVSASGASYLRVYETVPVVRQINLQTKVCDMAQTVGS
jgi:hypothetical protein